VCLQAAAHSHTRFLMALLLVKIVKWEGFKPHLICYERGELLNFVFIPANTNDSEPLDRTSFMNNVKSKLLKDNGYLSQKIFERLLVNDI
jgi:hypothetical protein